MVRMLEQIKHFEKMTNIPTLGLVSGLVHMWSGIIAITGISLTDRASLLDLDPSILAANCP